MNSLLQDALRNGTETLESLASKYAINVKRHPRFPELAMLKYDMIDSPMGNPIVQECRGCIVNTEDAFNFVARPFDKFFNHGEGHARPIDWSTARVQEKLDGSLMILYFYGGEWQVASSGTPDAGGPINGLSKTFRDLFWNTFYEVEGYNTTILSREYTYMFELMTEANRVVVMHPEPKVTMIGLRHTLTGLERNPSPYHPDFRVVREFPLTSLAEVEASMEHFSGLEQEGYVVVDGSYNRVKIKHPKYVAVHHMVGRMNPKNILECVRVGETPEILTYFPQWADEFAKLESAYAKLVQGLEEEYEAIKDIPVQKDFALKAAKTRCSGALFARRAKGTSFRTFLKDMDIKNLMGLLDVRAED